MNRKAARRQKIPSGTKGKTKDGLPKITEADVQDECRDLLESKGIFYYREVPGALAHKGIPDLVGIYSISVERLMEVARDRDIQTIGIFLGIECKSPTGKQSEDQEKFEKQVNQANGLYLLIDDPQQLASFLEVEDYTPWRGKRITRKKRARY